MPPLPCAIDIITNGSISEAIRTKLKLLQSSEQSKYMKESGKRAKIQGRSSANWFLSNLIVIVSAESGEKPFYAKFTQNNEICGGVRSDFNPNEAHWMPNRRYFYAIDNNTIYSSIQVCTIDLTSNGNCFIMHCSLYLPSHSSSLETYTYSNVKMKRHFIYFMRNSGNCAHSE